MINCDDFVSCILVDKLLVEAYCQKYKTKVMNVFPNTEEFPVKGLMYVFGDNCGGYTIEGIKKSLNSNLENNIA